MRYYPVFLNLQGRKVVVVGGGKVAEGKVRVLLRYGADVRVISPSLTTRLRTLARRGDIRYQHRSYRAQDIRKANLILAATDDRGIQEAIARDACRNKLLVNVADRPELCSFIAPSILSRGELTIAISTGGASPALAQKLRQDLGKQIGQAYGDFLQLMRSVRREILQKIPSQSHRRRIFHRLLNSGLLEILKRGHRMEARRRLSALMAREGLKFGKTKVRTSLPLHTP